MAEEVVLSYIIPLIFLCCGLGLLIAGIVKVSTTLAFLRKAIETEGEIVALECEPAMEPGDPITYRPVVSFQPKSNQTAQFRSMVHSNPPAYAVGERVRVLYEPECVQEACIRSFSSLWLLAIILLGLGLTFTLLGAGLLLGWIPL